MDNIFIRIKHWQFFLLFIVLSYFIKDKITNLIIVSFILSFFSMWIYSIATLGNKKLDEYGIRRHSTETLKYSCFFIPFTWLIIAINPASLFNSNLVVFGFLMLALVMLFLSSFIYSIFFAAKVIKTLELKRPASFKESVLIMLGILIWPIGIWFVQPKVNHISE